MRALGVLALLAFSLLLAAKPAYAEPQWGPLDVGVGGHAGLTVDIVCRQTSSDVITCSPIAFAGLQLASRCHLSEGWALGVLGSWSNASSDYRDQRSLWAAAAEGRWYPFGLGRVNSYLGVSAGVVAAVDELIADELGDAEPASTVAPTLGASLGADFRLSGPVHLGPSLGGFVFAFPGRDEFDRAPDYGTLGGFLLTINLSYSPRRGRSR